MIVIILLINYAETTKIIFYFLIVFYFQYK